MSKVIDITGKTFSQLTVLCRNGSDSKGKAVWTCVCSCGNVVDVDGTRLRNGSVKSCGCLKHKAYTSTHHMTRTRLYYAWANMRNRCKRESVKSYKDYGARGIKVCAEWEKSFESFRDWALENGYSDDLTIERKNHDGDYCPENCCWVTKAAQANNRRMCVEIEYNGRTQNLMQWCNELGLNYKRIHNRMNKLGMTFEEAISKPVETNKRNKKARSIYG
nr:MAG TPA: PVL ORF-50-like family [Caudoviricetes sp.]DAH49188.1 MAG TPA: PVL ORF-50-like family [Caudoviricetes sp.]